VEGYTLALKSLGWIFDACGSCLGWARKRYRIRWVNGLFRSRVYVELIVWIPTGSVVGCAIMWARKNNGQHTSRAKLSLIIDR
jgi:hypothetical protein